MINLTLNGLMKEADYWIKTRTPKTDVKTPEKLSDYDIEYTYYVVFSISKTNFERQVSAAMDDVPDNDDQTKFLKEVLTTKLKDSIITNKNPVVVDFLTAVEYTQPFYDKKRKLTILLHILTGKLEYRILRQKRYVLRQNTNLFWILRHRQNSL